MSNGNFDVVADAGHSPIKMWTRGVDVEDAALQQLKNLSGMPFVYKHIAAMPDVHWGRGATVGSVIATTGAIIPAAVGVDIGCGMVATRTSLTASDLPDSLNAMRTEIEKNVPHGRTDNGGRNDRGAWHNLPDFVVDAFDPMMGASLKAGLNQIIEMHPKIAHAAERAPHHIGTLGTGNHFIEVCLDQQDRVWIMLHSGSRGIGNKIGDYFINLAKADMKKWFINLPDADLAYLPEGTEHFDDYVQAVLWAQGFALANREVMLARVIVAMQNVLGRVFDTQIEAINCHHNYVDRERHFGQNVWVTRKGAVRARIGDRGIIPGSMGARSYIVLGKGDQESFHSCSHGAGRLMSRGEAKRRITLADHAADTAGIECRKDADVLDESPKAYKPIDAVMAAQTDLVDVLYELRQILNVKG
jgi:tRNA-splicing ligase RtcB (3'-phosphate/5'-hydroxy nucleic acid ligase)